MILIFDLDDTLYEEIDYVKSGFREVAKFSHLNYGLNENDVYSKLIEILASEGRGRIFDMLLFDYGIYSKARVKNLVKVYRHHLPDISLPKSSEYLLANFKSTYPLYLVTDGHKVVQSNKVKALSINEYMKGVYITHRYGIEHSKPSLYCFDLIRKKEQVDWCDLIYVGDNPNKDFVTLNKVGAITIRVKTGVYASFHADVGYDGLYSISNLEELPSILIEISHGLENFN